MIENVVHEVMKKLYKDNLTPEQLKRIEIALYATLNKYEISLKSTEIIPIEADWQPPLEYFLARKKMNGDSDGTIEQYRFHLTRALGTINKKINDITEADVILYLAAYKSTRGISNSYLNTIRRVMSTFFSFMCRRGEIRCDPTVGIEPIKSDKRLKKAYSDEDLERIRRGCTTLRDMAMVEFLYATGVRVSEMVALNRDDVKITDREVIVYGKGSKERRVYLTPVSCMYLREYLGQREDDNPALFVGLKAPHNRIGKRNVESCLQKIGASAGVPNVHPHRFRRTTATNLLRKGMPIEEVQTLLGHEQISTTLIYTEIAEDSVKIHHSRFMSA